MKDKIKTREVVKNIKAHDSAVNVGGRIKDVGVKTKDKVIENTSPNENVSPEQYAADKVTEKMKTGVESAAVGAKKVTKKATSKATEKIKEKKAEKNKLTDDDAVEPTAEQNDKSNGDTKGQKGKKRKESEQQKADIKEKIQSMPKEHSDNTKEKTNTLRQKKQVSPKSKERNIRQKSDGKHSEDIKQSTKAEIKEKTQHQPKTNNVEALSDTQKTPRQRQQAPPKTRGKANIKEANTDKGVRKPTSQNEKIKQSKNAAEKTGKTIKTSKNSVKNTGKTVKTAKSTTKATAETAKRTKEAAKTAAKATVKAVKATVKVIEATGKAVVAGVKSLGAALAAIGVPTVAVVIVICLIAAIGGTCFGIFLSNDESTGTDKTMSQAITELTSEHYSNLTAMKTSYTYDFFEVQGNASINWKDVLAVYAVKTTTSSDEPLEVVTIDDKKLDLLREIVNDMNTMTGVVTPKVVAETTVTTDAEGNPVKTTTYVTKKVLTVVIVQLNANQIAEVYKFNDEQKAQLAELMSEDYNALWAELVGANGDIVVGEGNWQGTNIFTWPLAVDGTITSRFGTRTDPISGEISTHGGTDIAAAEGTPILAAADGTVVSATWHNSYGYYVKIKHNDTYSTLYAHSSALLVSSGQTVKQGQTIALVGSTGYSTGPHLHYEIIQNGVRVDALRFYSNI